MITKKTTIYVVDRDESIRRALKRLIQSQEFEVKTFASAEDFLSFDPPDRPSCVVLDIRVAKRNELALTEEFAERVPEIPIIFTTAHDDAYSRKMAKEAGAIAYLEKPFDNEELIEAIKLALG